MAQRDKDMQKIKKLIKIMQENDLVEVEIKHGEDKVLLKRAVAGQPMMTAAPAPGQIAAPAGQEAPEKTIKEEDEGLVEIKSPMVGTFYRAASPDSEAFVEVGSEVQDSTVVSIIEAMKVMNEIKAGVAGTIAKIMVTNGQAVEFGQVLFKVKPA